MSNARVSIFELAKDPDVMRALTRIPREPSAPPPAPATMPPSRALKEGEYTIVSGQKMSHKAAAMFRLRALEAMTKNFQRRMARIEKEAAQIRAQVEAMP